MMNCVQLANVCFGLQTMLCIGITFLFTLFTLFASYKAFYYHDVDKSVALSSIFWCVFYNYFKLCIVYTSNLVDSENQELSTSIYKVMNKDICSPTVVQSFGYQIKQLPSKSSCGLFNFDYSLIMTVWSYIDGKACVLLFLSFPDGVSHM